MPENHKTHRIRAPRKVAATRRVRDPECSRRVLQTVCEAVLQSFDLGNEPVVAKWSFDVGDEPMAAKQNLAAKNELI